MTTTVEAPTRNRHVAAWVDEMARLCQPDRVYWCDGSEAERDRLTKEAVDAGILIPLDPKKRPNSYYSRSNPNDVARTEELTFVCTPTREEAGPTNNWMEPGEMRRKLEGIYRGSMKGRTMYVVPYVMGPEGSPFAKIGIELTDSVYVALNIRIMARMGNVALDLLGASNDFNRGLHSVADCDPSRRYITHFPQDNAIWSVGSGYGGNALLNKKCLALRISSYLARQEGWLAEHMLLLEAESPTGEVRYVAAGFPSACGKTNLAMLVPPRIFGDWKVRTLGDDIVWLRIGEDGRLYALNPEAGFFGVAPGTSMHTNPNAMRMLSHDAIFTNVALTKDGDVWWEGMDGPAPEGTLDWRGRPWTPSAGEPAAHPNSRFTVALENNPALSPRAHDPRGVPVSALIFGGRRSTTVPLVLESFNWTHGVYLAGTMGSETTAAKTGAVGVLRRDPMANIPFVGYDMGTYLEHWLEMGARIPHPPRLFLVNWFRKDARGKFLWPGFGENMRAIKWILDRCDGRAGARETPVGWTPRPEDLELRELGAPREAVEASLAVDPGEWLAELVLQGQWLDHLGPTVPRALRLQHELLLGATERAAEQREARS
ncbi:MAG TPA: phosphoenolpyruvate carboxykinase (GTP) [Candidatus Limnocylindria bacterium]|nr:phosphoenolpyruvate carboxykinase (GTP) [Candidatus Limnocylindria bacterium]